MNEPTLDKNGSEPRIALRMEHFLKGRFAELAWHVHAPGDVYLFMNTLRSLPREYNALSRVDQSKIDVLCGPIDSLTDKLLGLKNEDSDFFDTLFSMMKRASFTSDALPAIEEYFQRIIDNAQGERSRKECIQLKQIALDSAQRVFAHDQKSA